VNLNKAIIAGRISQAPELRTTPSGQSVATMRVATNRTWTDKARAKQEAAEFHTVVLWGKTAELASTFLQKGSLVLVEGRLETRSWTDKAGVARKATEIIAEDVQFGPRPTLPHTTAVKSAAPAKTFKTPEPLYTQVEMPVINLDGDEEDSGRTFRPVVEKDEDDIGDPPF
jgi:single-strand DNA-binding protein